MRVSYDWLKTMIDIPEDPKTLSDEYIRTGEPVGSKTLVEMLENKVSSRRSTPWASPSTTW